MSPHVPRSRRVLLLAALALVAGARAAPGRPRVGLVLSGGGARGAAHAGALRALEDLRVPVDLVAGTSAGAVVGALYASGRTPDEIERILADVDWAAAFDDEAPRREQPFRRKRDDESFLLDTRIGVGGGEVKLPSGIVEGQQMLAILQRELAATAHVRDFDALPVPFRAVTTDIVTGETIVLSGGSLAQAVRASGSIPGIFSPVRIDGRLLVDGGVTDNVPIDVARSMGADILVVVDVTSPLGGEDAVRSVVGVVNQLTSITTLENARRQIALLRPEDVLVQPALTGIGTLDFPRAKEAVVAGEAAMRARAESLRALVVHPDEHAAWIARLRPPRSSERIDTVMATTDSGLSIDAILARVRQEPGEPLDVPRLEQDVARIHGLGSFESVTWRIEGAEGRRGLALDARRLAAAAGYVQLGLALDSDAQGRNRFQVGAAYTRPTVNSWGAEWRTEAQLGEDALLRTAFHQPLGGAGRWFAAPTAWMSRDVRALFEGEDRPVAEHVFAEGGFGLEAGRELGTWGEASLGIRRARGESDRLLGDPALPVGGYDRGAAMARIGMDLLDDLHFPRRGARASVAWTASRESLGADARFDRLDLSALCAVTRGRGTVVGSIRLVRTIDGTLPPPDRVQLGGFLNLSGLREDQLDGQELGLARIVWSWRLERSRLFPVHVGLSLEAGNAWQQSDEIGLGSVIPGGSAFLGYESPIGPLFLGLGLAEGGRAAVHLHLGRAF